MSTTVLYLVSAKETVRDAQKRAERTGGQAFPVSYWKVGVTSKANPLMRDRARYQEVFRAVEFADELWTAEEIQRHLDAGFSPSDVEGVKPGDVMETSKRRAEFVEWYIRRAFNVIGTPVGRESLDGSASLHSVSELFDQMVSWSKTGQLCWVDPEYTAAEKARQIREFVYADDPDGAEARIQDDFLLWQRLECLMDDIRESIESASLAQAVQVESEPMWA